MSEPYYETAEQSEISLKLQLEKVYEFVDNSKLVFLSFVNSEGHIKTKTIPIYKRFNGVDLWFFISKENFNLDYANNKVLSITFVNESNGEWITYNGTVDPENDFDVIQSILKNKFQRAVYHTTNTISQIWTKSCDNVSQFTQKAINKLTFSEASTQEEKKEESNEAEPEKSISIQTNFVEPNLFNRIYQAAKGSLVGENTKVMVVGELSPQQLNLARQIETPLIKSKL
ncbi:hypothetical protein CONCODRAFT_84570 [Conidiobolus coronatus NRRL 28638]|uniref:Uncharacterized protein n=1 Tax=Conidiobolus coronatus (strain ATCC 28846 / CBS 209.66 / NRRL 28638) TaxID=796925 RepID=A0A137P9I2_CONC2|nr:hypothetical protein CONCODRAFT_84570 [Conidiobolus coronatus NRRL 28638]|eukprot:KXN71665.1 hypothetical protein CONCODRAFT_84570 [Conidiobolus coronatus NRRL 28638]